MSRPLPRPTSETQPFWDGCSEGILRYQRCERCASVQLIPRSLCASCQSSELAWKTSEGLGILLSYTTVHRAPTMAFKEEVPYVIALLDMAEGFRLMVNVKDGANTQLEIGQRMRIRFCEVDGVALPQAEVIE